MNLHADSSGKARDELREYIVRSIEPLTLKDASIKMSVNPGYLSWLLSEGRLTEGMARKFAEHFQADYNTLMRLALQIQGSGDEQIGPIGALERQLTPYYQRLALQQAQRLRARQVYLAHHAPKLVPRTIEVMIPEELASLPDEELRALLQDAIIDLGAT